ncbi:hypothetical protein CTRI78_v010381 [Colletotrichum trifolii]|uniref:Uncharacterized protein n=1 Tax=Colletotrichum trifolii TaxID=5466 RepID=A0A4V3HTL3_COLTR|nr:hypothetical protein CTRI78_v010381 [Colletotrichum trifolii]
MASLWNPTALPLFTSLLAILGAADGISNLVRPDLGAANFGLTPPSRTAAHPSQLDAFHHALVKVKGARNLHMASCVVGLALYGACSETCRASPAAALAVRRCLGIVLALGSGVGFSGAAVISDYVAGEGVDEGARELGRSKMWMHLVTNVPILALGVVYLFY